MPDHDAPDLHELETEVMDAVWGHDARTVRDVLEVLNGQSGRTRAYTTIMTVMSRLADKGLLLRHREGRADVYTARLTRDEWARARAAQGVEELVDSYGDHALAHFARRIEGLDPSRRAELRRIAELDD